MRTLTRTLIYRRRCPRRPWKTAAMVVWKGQQVSEFGYWHYGEVGEAECTACGGTHLLLWSHRGFFSA